MICLPLSKLEAIMVSRDEELLFFAALLCFVLIHGFFVLKSSNYESTHNNNRKAYEKLDKRNEWR